ncbi:MAG: hypothetical protein ABI867_08365 [Kofleriaceae bacterium]
MTRALVLAIVCGCVTTAHDATTVRQVNDDTWMIEARNGGESRSDLHSYAYERAMKVCPNGFDPLDTSRGFAMSDGYGKIYNAAGPFTIMAVKCRGYHFWCTQTTGFGACHSTPNDCEQYRVKESGDSLCGLNGECAYSACYNAPQAVCGTTGCYTDQPSCARLEARFGRDPRNCQVR